MVEKEPRLFKNWNNYMKFRQIMASAVIFKNHGWAQWQIGHAKLFGILLWNYETKKTTKFKYSDVLKKQGYRRTHNYRLLKAIVENDLLQRDGNGYYIFTAQELRMVKRVLIIVKKLDIIGKKKMIMGVRENR
jgi:hypothetical protein